jgi:hypothetical protein
MVLYDNEQVACVPMGLDTDERSQAMINPPDRVWLVFDANGEVQFVAEEAEVARVEAALLGKDWTTAAPHVVHEYRLHRPIPWRTGVPDVETVGRCANRFSLLLTNGGLLRRARRNFGLWYWRPPEAESGVALGSFDIAGWCPEDEMPEGETT